MSWTGRQLNSITINGTTSSYLYNADGIRTRKTVGSATTDYFLNGSTILAEQTGSNVIWYIYDGGSDVLGFIYNGTPYYYLKNQQGDVLSIVDASNNVVGSYTYDAWGKVLSATGSMAQINPIRYRSYYYDTESNMYYLQSRYYDPEVGRFINADDTGYLGASGSVLSYNLFAYCGNNPTNMIDYDGHNAWAIQRRAASAITLLALLTIIIKACGISGASNFWNPVGWVLLAVAGIAIVCFGVYSLVSYFSNQTLKSSMALISYASTAATPPPPNRGGKGTKTTSKTLYNKNGYRLDVENPGNRIGQIHLQYRGSKYYYNIADQTFRVGSSAGRLAPNSIQALLKDPQIINALAKGLRILGY